MFTEGSVWVHKNLGFQVALGASRTNPDTGEQEVGLLKVTQDLPANFWSPIRGWWNLKDLVSEFRLKSGGPSTILGQILCGGFKLKP